MEHRHWLVNDEVELKLRIRRASSSLSSLSPSSVTSAELYIPKQHKLHRRAQFHGEDGAPRGGS